MASSPALSCAPKLPHGQTVTPAALGKAKKACEASLQAFEAALRKHDPKLTVRFGKLCQNSAPGLGDIVSTVDEIVDAAAKRRPTNDRTFATRFIKLLERIKGFATIGDVFVGGAQNMVVSGVWGSVRLAIEVCRVPVRFLAVGNNRFAGIPLMVHILREGFRNAISNRKVLRVERRFRNIVPREPKASSPCLGIPLCCCRGCYTDHYLRR